ncbi:MAG: hypothetical protein R2795_22430 [Saprospiraceae bacterium]
MKARLFIPAALLVLLAGILMSVAAHPATYKAGPEAQSFFDRLVQPSTTSFTLTFDMGQLEAMKRSEDYYPATFTYQGEQWEAEVKVRGRYRRRICEFPPLSLKLSKDMLRAAGLEGHNKFKLVTHCDAQLDAEDNILREQLAYDLYHLLTGEGYRTRLVSVTYRDAVTGHTETHPAILIEDTDEMAQQLGGTECDDCAGLTYSQYVPGNPEQVALFQYLIGNSDWGTTMPRNIKVVQLQAGGRYKAVPYDFDFSGLVNAEYAKPNVNYGQTTVTQRVWIWEFDSASQIDAVVNRFLQKEQEVMTFVTNYPGLSNKSRRQVLNYLSACFQEFRAGDFRATVANG